MLIFLALVIWGAYDQKQEARKMLDEGKERIAIAKKMESKSISNSSRQTASSSDSTNSSEESSFFSVKNISSLKYRTGSEIVSELKANALAEGFKLTSVHKISDSYICLKCSKYKKAFPCKFYIHIQEHNHNSPNQFYQPTKNMCLEHNHPLNALSYAHELIDEKTKQIIKSMSEVNIDSTKISEFLYKEKSIKLTSKQVTYLIRKDKNKQIECETNELIKKIVNEKGLYKIFPEEFESEEEESLPLSDLHEQIHYRRAIASFTEEELRNLNEFGDFVCLDPTYPSLTNNWTTIPISVVGKGRELHSGGVIFCSNVFSEIYQWIIKLLVYELPCSNIIKTICSDDDTVLESAFNNLQSDPKCSNIDRIICIWHKMCQFTDIIKRIGMDANEQKQLVEKFKEMAFTKDEQKCQTIIEDLKGIHSSVFDFITKSIENRLKTSTKAFTKQVLSLGYLSNVFSECNNSNIRRLIGSKALSLCEMRDIITRADERRKMNREYFKMQSYNKLFDPRIFELMSSLKLDEKIAASIAESLQKSLDLKIEKMDDSYKITELKTNDSFIVTNTNSWFCTCGKLTSTGLPCSHIFKVFEYNEIPIINVSSLISRRWILTEKELNVCAESIAAKENFVLKSKKNGNPSSSKQRFINISAKMQSIADLGSRSQGKYDMVMNSLKIIENKLLGIKKVVDSSASRCGRPRKGRIKKAGKIDKCQICKKDHKTKQCPDLKNVRKFIDFKPEKGKSNRHCVICEGTGHFTKTCPALKKWKSSIQIEEEEEEEENYSDYD